METNNIKVYILNNDSVKIDVIENVNMINIKDKNYNLLIMKDYWPLIGELDGSLSLDGPEVYNFENIKGFYTLSQNVFHLIIREEDKNDK